MCYLNCGNLKSLGNKGVNYQNGFYCIIIVLVTKSCAKSEILVIINSITLENQTHQ